MNHTCQNQHTNRGYRSVSSTTPCKNSGPLIGKSFVIVLSAISCYIFSAAAQTETYIGFGAGVNGANRRVRTVAGNFNQPWVQVEGSFTEPTAFYIPPRNTYHTVVDMYLGSGGDVEVDAGLHYEPNAQRNLAPGWVLFVSQGGHYTYCGRGAVVYRCDKRYLGAVRLTYRVLVNGGVELEAVIPQGNDTLHGHYRMLADNDGRNAGDEGATGALPVYPNIGGFITTQTLSRMNLKKVVAMSQSDPAGGQQSAFIDGSYLRRAVWSQGKIGFANLYGPNAYYETGGRIDITSAAWAATGAHLDLVETGLVPRGRDDRGNWIVDYPDLAPEITGAYRMAWINTTGRYENEKVDISLRRARNVRGRPVRRVTR